MLCGKEDRLREPGPMWSHHEKQTGVTWQLQMPGQPLPKTPWKPARRTIKTTYPLAGGHPPRRFTPEPSKGTRGS